MHRWLVCNVKETTMVVGSNWSNKLLKFSTGYSFLQLVNQGTTLLTRYVDEYTIMSSLFMSYLHCLIRQMCTGMLRLVRSDILRVLNAEQLLSAPLKKSAKSVTATDSVKKVYSYQTKRCMKWKVITFCCLYVYTYSLCSLWFVMYVVLCVHEITDQMFFQ